MGNGDLITTKQAAVMLRVSRRTVIRMAERAELPHEQQLPGLRGAYLFNRAVVELIARQRQEAKAS